MAYRLVDTEIWDDEYIGDLEPEAKLVWLCLLTNDKANITGLYRITFKAIADMTGLDRARVEQIMARFDGAGKALYRDGWVFVVNYQEYQMRKVNGKIRAHIKNHLDTVPNGYLKEAYWYRYPIDTLSIPNDEIGNQKSETGNRKSEIGNPKSGDDGRASRSEAYKAFERITGRTINPATADEIDELCAIKGIEEFERALRLSVTNNANYPLKYARQVLLNEGNPPAKNGKKEELSFAELLGLPAGHPARLDV